MKQASSIYLVVFAFGLWGCPNCVGQVLYNPASPTQSNNAANRSLAALDLAILAAESGLPDVSFEAVKRAVGNGPPVAVVQLGGILSGGQARNRGYGSSRPSAEANAQTLTAARLIKVNQAWEENEISPAECYAVWKEIVFPAGRPSEGFAYSTKQNNNSYSYSLSLTMKEPEAIACGARVLVDWAAKAGKLDDLKAAMSKRASMPPAQATIQLLNIILAENDDSIDRDSICEKLASTPDIIVSGPDCELLTSAAYKMLAQMEDGSESKAKLWEAILSSCQSKDRWASNNWLRYVILHEAHSAIKGGDKDRFERFSNVALSILAPLSQGNEDYRASVISGYYQTASSAAFETGNIELGLQYMREQLVAQSTRSTNGRELIQPNNKVSNNLLKLTPEKRYELLEEIVWSLPVLGLSSAAQRAPAERIPAPYVSGYKNYRKTESLPFEAITSPTSESLSLLEWVMRDAIKLGKTQDVVNHIQELVDNESDDAVLAKLVWAKVNSDRIDLDLVTDSDDEGKTVLRKEVTPARGPLLPLDYSIARAAIENESTLALGKDLAERLAARGLANRTNDVLHGRSLLAEALLRDKSKPDASQLQHFVVTHDFGGSDLLGGLPTKAYWFENEEGAWEHYACGARSSLLLKYPLTGKFEIAFEASDNTYAESGCTLGGLNLDFRGYMNDVALELVGSRSATQSKTEGINRSGEFTSYKLVVDMDEGAVTLFCGDNEVETFSLGETAYPFYGMHSMMHRKAVTKNIKISGEVAIADSVNMLRDNLCGWSTRFKNRQLPPYAFTVTQRETQEKAEKPKRADLNYDWHLVDGVLESVDHEALMKIDEENGEKVNRPKYKRRESWVYYVRPLCDGESVAFEFFHEAGKISLAPTIDRTAIWIDREAMLKHWITPAGGAWFGVNSTNRVNVAPKEKLGELVLNNGAWNAGRFERDGDIIRIIVNGQPLYEQPVDESCGGRIGFFHDPSMYQVRVRNVTLKGNWPEKLPEDIFEKLAASE